jgi:DNA-binding PadR family transcriptional regulator
MINDKGLLGGSTVLMLLALLTEEDCYGYEIIRRIADRSDDAFQFKEGTLYPVLHKMESDGLVKSYRKETENGKTRTYYRITDRGAKELAAEREKWNEFTNAVNKVVRGGAYAV